MPIQRPTWLPKYLPELDGLRGLAILAVVLYHCHPRLEGTWIYYASLWGWAGVILFFTLSGFLITSILLTTRDKPHYFHNFHARRALRIWPVYLLLLVVVYLNAPWFIGPSVSLAIKTAPWLAYIFCVQNLFHLALPPAIQPTWALAIEEQYYFVWAPLVRVLRAPWMLAIVLAAALVASPLVRHANLHWMTPTHTLIHLDGIAWGSLARHRDARLAIEPAHMALDGPGRHRAGVSGRGHHRRRHRVSRFRAGRGLCRNGAGADRIHWRAQSHQRDAALRARWPSTAASATAFI